MTQSEKNNFESSSITRVTSFLKAESLCEWQETVTDVTKETEDEDALILLAQKKPFEYLLH